MKKAIFLLYIIFISLIARYGFKKPAYNWDMLPYMAVVLGYDHPDHNYIHDTVYQIIRQQLPADNAIQLTDGGLAFRKKMAASSAEFYLQMPFYSVKPLYTRLVYLFYRCGIPLAKAVLLPSIIGFIGIGLLLFYWVKKYSAFCLSILICGLVMISGPMWAVLKCSTPDCLSACILLAAMYCMLEKKSLLLTVLLLLLLIFTRLDNIIFSFLILSGLRFSDQWIPKISIKKYLLLTGLMGISYFLISFTASQSGWNILYYPTFLKWMNLSYSYREAFSFKDYFSLAASHLMTGLFFSNLFLFLSLAMILFIGRTSGSIPTAGLEQIVVGVIVVTIIVRFVLQPVIDDRFYVGYYLVIFILLIKRLSQNYRVTDS